MNPFQTTARQTARQMDWAANSIALNLDYIPDDKLRFKPAATAPSSLEIVEHLLDVLHRMTPLVGGFEVTERSPEPVKDRDDAKARLIEAAAKYSAMLRAMKPEALDETIETHIGKLPRHVLAVMPVNDTIHHNGQIAYIQLMLGDTETHRDLSALINDN